MPICHRCRVEFVEEPVEAIISLRDAKLRIKLPSGNEWEYLALVDWIKFGSDSTTRRAHECFEDILKHSDQLLRVQTSATLEEKLLFLKETIDILEETGRKFVNSPYLLPDLMRQYWLEFLNRGDTPVDPAIELDACRRYLKLCETDSYQDWFDRQKYGNNQRLNREGEIQEIARVLMNIRVKIRSQYLDALAPAEQVLDRAKRWLLSRYSLRMAREIAFDAGTLRYYLAQWMPELVAMFVFLLVGTGWFSSKHPAVWSGPPVISWWSIPSNFWNSWPIVFVYFVVVAAGFKAFLELSSSRKKSELQVHLPRLAAGVLVGYLVLFPDDFWRNTISPFTICSLIGPQDTVWLLISRILVPLSAVFVYILIELNNWPGIQYPIVPKAFWFSLRGFAYSVLIGVIFCDLFGAPIVQRVVKDMGVCINILDVYPGVFGYVYREVILYLSPLALFIAVFIQLLWQEKSLTEKI